MQESVSALGNELTSYLDNDYAGSSAAFVVTNHEKILSTTQKTHATKLSTMGEQQG